MFDDTLENVQFLGFDLVDWALYGSGCALVVLMAFFV